MVVTAVLYHAVAVPTKAFVGVKQFVLTHDPQFAIVPHEEHAPHAVFENPVVVDAVPDHVQPDTFVQKVEPVVVKPSALHVLHVVCPGMGATVVPVAHAVPLATPEPQEKPAAHFTGAYTPVPAQKEPAVHAPQVVAIAAEKVVAVHSIGAAEPAGHREPAGHTTCAVLAIATGQKRPEVHAFAPTAVLPVARHAPGLHAVQADALPPL